MKRVLFFAVLVSVLLSCTGNGEREAWNRYSSSFPLVEEHPDHSLMAKWEGKEVLDSHLLDDMEVPGKWKVRIGHPSLGYTRDNCFEGEQALRYTVSMVDWDHINAPSERSPWGSFAGSQGGWSCISLEFDEPQDWTAYNRIAFRVYIHPSRNPNVSFFVNLVNGTGKDRTLTPGRETNFDIPQGEWRQVMWEIDYLPRDSVRRFDICQTMTGYDRDIGEQYVTLDFDSLELQKVEPDHYEGWDLPEGIFAFSHIGYRPGDHKSALAGMSGGRKFSIVDNEGRTVYAGKAGKLSKKGNDFAVLDFSRFRRPGVYTIRYGDAESKPFPIEDDVWLTPLFSAVNFYFCQRCGYPVEGIHGICHQDWQGFHGDEKKVINGGWHDAGDLSQGAWRTAYACYALMSALKSCRGRKDLEDLSARLLDEASWGVDWLLKTRFSDGYHMSWSAQRIYSDNVAGTPDDVVSVADLVPWELFQTSAVFSSAVGLLEEARSKELEAAAKEDWGNAMKSRADWDSATYLEASWGAIASTLLFEKYKDEEYRSAALMFGRLLMDCQEQEYVDGIPYRGYFYTDNSRKSILQDYHAAFNEAPMMAIGLLVRVFPKEKDTPLWKQAAMIFINDYLKPGSRISAPYCLLPAGIFRRVDVTGYPDQLTQYEDGTQINDDYAIRTFPIWHDHVFHGSTNFHLSQAWALAEAAAILDDKEAMGLVQDQLEWTFGRNPFGMSLMYGVGYDYAPLFAYCTHNIVGALPVGVDCFHGDEPFWNGSAWATSKEIWVEPVSRFLGTLACYLRNN